VKLLTVLGARPQFIKAAPVSRALSATNGVREILVHTGQHFDENMSKVFFDELDIPMPDYNLGIGGGTHGQNTGRMLEAVESVLLKEKPDYVLVYGDTDTTLAGALAAVKMHIPVAHVEAGLRSFNRKMPEEINRVLTDHISELLFAPTETAVRNLLKEGLPSARIHLVGDVMYDAALFYADRAEKKSRILKMLDLNPKQYILATVHRAENTDDTQRLKAIFRGLALVSEQMPVVIPLHPRTRRALEGIGMLDEVKRKLRIIDPVGYLDMVMLEKNARLIVTDSGGVQKEAFFYRVPCVTLRDETEWLELVELGWNHLTPPISAEAVQAGVRAAMDTEGRPGEPYGKGDSAPRIVQILVRG